MSDISKEIQSFREAVYGEEVRKSLISLAEKVNDESTIAKEVAEEAATDVHAAILVVETAANNADAKAELADSASQKANNMAANAKAAAEEAKKYVLGDISNKTVEFTTASIDAEMISGESLRILLGKIDKRFSQIFKKLTWKSIPFTESGKGTSIQEIFLPDLDGYMEIALYITVGDGRAHGLIEIIPLIDPNIRKIVVFDNGIDSSASIVNLVENILTIRTVSSSSSTEYDYHNITNVYAR